MGRESRHYRKRSASRGRSGSRSKSRSPDKRSKKDDGAASRNRDRDRNRRGERSRSRDRRRSRSRDRKRPRRSRSREKRRSRSRDRNRRSRSRGRRSQSASPSKSRKTDETLSKSKEKDNPEASAEKKKIKEEQEEVVEDQDFDQNKLEEEMRKRKERVEKWREDQRKKALGNIEEIKREIEEMKQGKKWSLEDDDDDDEEGTAPEEEAEEGEEGKGPEEKEEKKEEEEEEEEEVTPMEQEAEDELDTLDAYMEEVKEEVKKFNMGPQSKGNDKKGGVNVSKVVTVCKTKRGPNVHKKKGELMENDQDAMEYSSEEEEVDLATALTGYQTKQRKVLEPVDHQKIEYEPYRKDFYVEVPELAKMSPEEVNVHRLDLEGIAVKGKGCPKPIKSWVQCGTSMKILSALKRHSYEKPTPIQAQAIPAIMSGRDLIGIAKTGSGKTIAFLLPMYRHIMDQRPLEEAEGPIAVIMTPTRELALQITKECKKFSKPLNLRVVCVYGGTGISEQIAELKRGAEIIVCTPGRMIDMLGANSGE